MILIQPFSSVCLRHRPVISRLNGTRCPSRSLTPHRRDHVICRVICINGFRQIQSASPKKLRYPQGSILTGSKQLEDLRSTRQLAYQSYQLLHHEHGFRLHRLCFVNRNPINNTQNQRTRGQLSYQLSKYCA